MLLEVENLSVEIGGKKILHNINFSISSYGLYFILGPNGSGKSTLLQAIAKLIPFYGKIKIFGKDIRKMKRKEIVEKIGYVWQNPFHGFFEYTVRREIEFILKNLKIENGKRIKKVAEIFGIENLLERSPFTLSGGEAKRVSLASVLIANQPILLLDEPESEMDIEGIQALIEYIISNIERKLIIVATHNTFLTIKLRKRINKIFLLKNGMLVGEFSTDVLEDSPLLEDVGIVSLRWLNEPA